MKRANSNKFLEVVEKVVEGECGDLPSWLTENVQISYVRLAKVRNENRYDITVSVDDAEAKVIEVKEVIRYACEIYEIDFRKILIEV